MSFLSARKAAKLTQSEAAKLLGVSEATISQWENRETYPKASRLPIIAAIYNCTFDELLTE